MKKSLLALTLCFLLISNGVFSKRDDLEANADATSNAYSENGEAFSGAISNAEIDKVVVDENGNVVDTGPFFRPNDSAALQNENTNFKQEGSEVCEIVNWTDTHLKARDISVAYDGEVYGAGTDGRLYKYKLLANTWSRVEGNFDLNTIAKVAIGHDGTPYVITQNGTTYYLTCDNKWILLPGCASDIAVGYGGEIYKIGCDKRENGFGIYRLHCGCKKACCNKSCKRFINDFKETVTQKSLKRADENCKWTIMDGSGVKLEIDMKGNPYVIQDTGLVFKYDGAYWRQIPAIEALSIAISSENILFIVNKFGQIYRAVDETNGVFQCLQGTASLIDVGGFNLPFIADLNGNVHFSGKMKLN